MIDIGKAYSHGLIIHCRTKDEAKQLLEAAHKYGLKWNNTEEYKNNYKWEAFGEYCCYDLREGRQQHYQNFIEHGYYNIPIPFDLFHDYNKYKEINNGNVFDNKYCIASQKNYENLFRNNVTCAKKNWTENDYHKYFYIEDNKIKFASKLNQIPNSFEKMRRNRDNSWYNIDKKETITIISQEEIDNYLDNYDLDSIDLDI